MRRVGHKRLWQRLGMLAMLMMFTAGPIVLVAQADNTTLNGAHWSRRESPFNLRVGNNVSGRWTSYLDKAAADWTRTGVVTMRVVNGQAGRGRDCEIIKGRVEVCNADFGANGWLGLSRVLLTADREHIVGASVRLNDYYFTSGRYNDPKAKQHTVCHELGHTIGLDHVNYASCMNDSNRSVFADTKPVQKDKRTLNRLYKHKDRKSSAQSRSESVNATALAPAAEPALPDAADTSAEVITEAVGDDLVLVTIITWADDAGD